MEYNKIIAVTGLPGLYELLSSKTDGAIVRSLDDKSTKFVSSRIHNFSHLESIEIFTTRENVNLLTILKAMEESGEKLPDEKNGTGLKGYFEKVYPELDFERVYSSDLKKMVKWFVVLKNNDIELKHPEVTEEEVAEEAPVTEKKAASSAVKGAAVEEPAVEEKPKAKKPAAKAPDLEKPATPAKKVVAEKEQAPAPKTDAKTPSAEKPAAEKPAAPAKKAAPAKPAAAAEEKPAAKKPAAKKKSQE